MNELQERQLTEVRHRLRWVGFEVCQENNGLLPIKRDYRILAEFGNVVLAGHERENGYGVEFVTWERIQTGTGLWQGNYYENDCTAAKQNFATRSGLIPPALLFTSEQLAVILDAAQNMTAEGFVSNPKQEKLLEQIMEQIEKIVLEVIDLTNELTQYPKQHELGGMEQI